MNITWNNFIRCIFILAFVNLFLKSNCKKIKKIFRHAKHKEKIVEEIQNLKKGTERLCTNPKRKGDRLHHLTRHPRDTRFLTKHTRGLEHSVYFSGHEIIKLRAFYSRIPSDSFTYSIMVNPEGGQNDPVTILDVIDICNGKRTNNWLKIGISSIPEKHKSGQRIFVTLKTERNKFPSTVYSNVKYTPGWTRIDVTYNNAVLKMYKDGALVSVNKKQQGPVFQEVTRSCKTLLIGGDEPSKTFYRGYVTGLKVWNYAKNHSELRQISYDEKETSNQLFIHDNFVDVKKWRSLFKKLPRITRRDMTSHTTAISLKAPPCGETVCDDPIVVDSYKINRNLRDLKEISYRVFNILNDDGSNPQITRKDLRKQHLALVNAFMPYNITFKLDTKDIRSTRLRSAIVLYTCDPRSIGDYVCDEECFHPGIGNDGGDCDHLLPVVPRCKSKIIGDGTCDEECNKFVWQWDGGDCCFNGSTSCFNPESPFRAYLSKDEFKAMVGEESSSHLNIYLASTINTLLAGLSTYPWDKEVYGISGGVVVPPESFGATDKLKGLVHEIGHVLGLWHVHHGISEMDCNDPCLETHASPELGDLCSDTEPTPDNNECHDPDGTKPTCGVQSFRNTPYRNYMSYSDDSCIDQFTAEQSARMHCYLDLVYQPWRKSKKPSPVPLPPKIVASTNESVTISWLPPFGTKQAFPTTLCDICTSAGQAVQFATKATASHPVNSLYIWQPKQATGAPDAQLCTASDKAWMMPDNYTCNAMECYIDLEFSFNVIPNKLSVWVTYAGSIDEDILTEMGDPIKFIEIMTSDNKTIPLGAFPVSCDTVLTIGLDVKMPVTRVRIYVPHPYTAIDAVELSSTEAAPECQHCRQQKYKIIRNPDFLNDMFIHTSKAEFTDRNLAPNTTYTYRVSVIRANHESVSSPPTQYRLDQSFCGDGMVDKGEECDDGNTADEDGCNLYCNIEEFFKCTGEPSHCFIHDGDGECEEFEKPYSVTDCGHYTPPGWEDQWVISAIANPRFQDDNCPPSLLIGIPPPNQKCVSNTVPQQYWNPCKNNGKEDNYWVQVFFAKPKVATEIIVHLGSDGIDELNRKQTMRVELLTNDNTTKPTTPELQSISCLHNPIKIPIIQDLTQPFFLTKGVRLRLSSPRISIAGVRLRSSKYLDPVTIASCDTMETYDPESGRCFNRSCSRPSCGNLRIKHGVPSCNGFKEGNTCTVSCDPGYQLDSSFNEIICVGGSWQSYRPLSCIPVDCGEPYIPYASVSCPDGFQLGNKCIFYCKSPAKLKGDVSTIQCDSDGTWSLPNAFCQIHCKAPSTTTSSRIMTKNCKRGYHPLGKICKFKCEKEFKVQGKIKIRKIYKLECGEDGTWKGDNCVPITCQSPDIVFKGLYRCSDVYNAGSTCTMMCPDNSRKQVITCRTDGTWDKHFRICSSAVNGVCPEVRDNRNVKFECNGHNVGNKCGVHCFLPNAVPTVNGHSNKVRGRLAGITDPEQDHEAVGKVTCTALLEWSPDPETITCKVGCNKDYIEDGLCQAEYNTRECSWDGGDCCESTVFGGMVLSIPHTCGKPCSCINPYAKENQKTKRKVKSKRKKARAKYRHLALSRYTFKNSRRYFRRGL